MQVKPILFKAEMVNAILEGRKTMTRRVVKPQPNWLSDSDGIMNIPETVIWTDGTDSAYKTTKCPYGQPGDVLWVWETWAKNPLPTGVPYMFKAEPLTHYFDNQKWKPSLFMPKDACRLFLEITNIRVERLQDITPEDAQNEGIEHLGGDIWKDYLNEKRFPEFMKGAVFTRTQSFQSLWYKINGKESWDANPWLWVVEFKVTDKPENF